MLLVVASRAALHLSDDAGNSFRELLLPEVAANVALGDAPQCVVRGQLVAIADAERGLCLSTDGGQTFRLITGAVNVSAVCAGEHAGAACVFAALHREAKDATDVLLIDPATGAASRVAHIPGSPSEDAEETGRTLALAWDGRALWAAGGFGLVQLTG